MVEDLRVENLRVKELRVKELMEEVEMWLPLYICHLRK